MGTLPQLLEEDIQRLDDVLREYLERSDASTALIIDKGGFLITSQGDARRFDLTTIGALASGAYLANQTIANLVHEENFDSVYQQGETFSMFVTNIDESWSHVPRPSEARYSASTSLAGSSTHRSSRVSRFKMALLPVPGAPVSTIKLGAKT